MFCKLVRHGHTMTQDKKPSLQMTTYLVLLCRQARSFLLNFILLAEMFFTIHSRRTAETCHSVKGITYSRFKKNKPNQKPTHKPFKIILLNFLISSTASFFFSWVASAFYGSLWIV